MHIFNKKLSGVVHIEGSKAGMQEGRWPTDGDAMLMLRPQYGHLGKVHHKWFKHAPTNIEIYFQS